MNKEQKAEVVDEIATQINESSAVIAIDYRGVSVPQAAALRAKLRDADTTFRIVKNSLTQRAADKAGADGLKELLEGPTAFAFVRGDAAMAAKALNDFTRELDTFQFKGGVMDGEPVSIDDWKAIARLPSRDMLYAQLVGVTASPITGLVRGLNGLISGLAIQLSQIAEKGLVGGAEPEAPAEATEPEAEAPAEEPEAEAEAPAEEPEAEAEAPAEATEPEAEAPAEESSTDESKE